MFLVHSTFGFGTPMCQQVMVTEPFILIASSKGGRVICGAKIIINIKVIFNNYKKETCLFAEVQKNRPSLY